MAENIIINRKKIPAMTPSVVHDYLYRLGCNWKGKGTVIELGSWLGATAVPLLKGLMTVGYNKPFYCYESWQAKAEQVIKARNQGTHLVLNQNTLPVFLKNTRSIYINIKAVRGSISNTIKTYKGGAIEICLFDAPKQNPVFNDAINALSPYWIPGVTILGLLDYYFYKSREKGKLKEKFKAPVHFIEQNADCFEKIAEWPDQCSCVFFKYVKELKL